MWIPKAGGGYDVRYERCTSRTLRCLQQDMYGRDVSLCCDLHELLKELSNGKRQALYSGGKSLRQDSTRRARWEHVTGRTKQFRLGSLTKIDRSTFREDGKRRRLPPGK